MRHLVLKMFLSLFVASVSVASIQVLAADNEQEAEMQEEREIGLRMDPLLFEAAAQFLKDAEVGDIVPAGAVSSARDGYVIQEYKILDGNGGEYGSFYRVRTLVAKPVKDVAVIFDKDGKVADIFDLRAPDLDEEATRKLESPKAPAAKTAEEGKDAAGKAGDEEVEVYNMEDVRFKSAPTGVMLSMLIGLDPMTETAALVSILTGIREASSLSCGGGMASINPAPTDPKVFQVKLPLPALGGAAPAFNLETVDGKKVSNSAFANKSYAVIMFSINVMVGLTSDDPLERRGAVMISRIGRWLEANKGKSEMMSRVLMVMADEKDKVEFPEQGQDIGGTLICEPKAEEIFGVEINPVVLVYGANGKLRKAFCATSEFGDVIAELEQALK